MIYGWRARIGQIRPATAIEGSEEWRRAAPEGVAFVDGRTRVREVTDAGLEEMMSQVVDVALSVAAAKPQVIVQCGAPGIFLKGPGYDEQVIKDIETATGVRATTMQTAQMAALKALGVRNIAVATIYTDEVNAKLKSYIEHEGIGVRSIIGLQIVNPQDCIYHEPEASYRLAKDAVKAATGEIDGILISCGGLRTFEIIEALETDSGVPVVTSNQASLWLGLRMADIPDRLPHLGRLLAEA